MTPLVLLLLGAGLVGCGPTSGSTASVLVVHEFESSADGWQIAGDTVDTDAVHHAGGGHPGGHITGSDEAAGEIWYFAAPASVLAHLPAAEGGALRFSLRQSEDTAGYIDDDIVIQGPAGRLSYRFAAPPGIEWREFVVPLSASAGWRWNWNADATDEQMRAVLRDATRLHIRGEFVPGPDEGGLDTVILTGPP